MLSDNESSDATATGSAASTVPAKSRGAVWNASWNAISTLIGIAISFIIAPLLIHTMGTDQYGILLLVWSVTGILGLVGLGFGEATLRYIAHYFGEGNVAGVNRIMGATLSFYLMISAVVCVVMFAVATSAVNWFGIAETQHGQFAWLWRLSALIFMLRAVTLTYGAVPMALQRYDISSKIGVVQSVVRSVGYVVLALTHFGIVELVMWDVVTQAGTLVAQAAVIRRLAPGVTLKPSVSLVGLREIAGFSVFSFLTYGFHMMQRESGKMILAAHLGPSPVAYLGTPDNIAQRIHMVVASGSETLMPRFSANRNAETARSLFWHGTWASLVISLVFLLPLVVLLPDFLKLWISPAFARESATVGQLVALSYISQGAYAPAATFFRGTGRPWLVTVVILFAGLTTLLGSVVLVPRYGAVGVGYAYLLGSLPAFAGLVHGWYHMFGRSSTRGLMRLVALPLVMAGVACGIQVAIRGWFTEITWPLLFALGAAFAAISSLLIVGSDWAIGGADAPSKQFLDKIGRSHRFVFLFRFLPARAAR